MRFKVVHSVQRHLSLCLKYKISVCRQMRRVRFQNESHSSTHRHLSILMGQKSHELSIPILNPLKIIERAQYYDLKPNLHLQIFLYSDNQSSISSPKMRLESFKTHLLQLSVDDLLNNFGFMILIFWDPSPTPTYWHKLPRFVQGVNFLKGTPSLLPHFHHLGSINHLVSFHSIFIRLIERLNYRKLILGSYCPNGPSHLPNPNYPIPKNVRTKPDGIVFFSHHSPTHNLPNKVIENDWAAINDNCPGIEHRRLISHFKQEQRICLGERRQLGFVPQGQ